MKITTKLKHLMFDNTLIMTQEGPNIQIIITNKESGNSHMVAGKNWTEATNAAIKDTRIHSIDGSFKF